MYNMHALSGRNWDNRIDASAKASTSEPPRAYADTDWVRCPLSRTSCNLVAAWLRASSRPELCVKPRRPEHCPPQGGQLMQATTPLLKSKMPPSDLVRRAPRRRSAGSGMRRAANELAKPLRRCSAAIGAVCHRQRSACPGHRRMSRVELGRINSTSCVATQRRRLLSNTPDDFMKACRRPH